jgi:K+-transporting ATPase ATPase B chain
MVDLTEPDAAHRDRRDRQIKLMTRGPDDVLDRERRRQVLAIIPAAFASTYPVLETLNVMNLATPASAILSAVIFNALIIPALIPLALRGVKFRAEGAAQSLRRNMLIYGVGGIILPFVGIKIIDVLLVALHLA